jgi:hypothetical protein
LQTPLQASDPPCFSILHQDGGFLFHQRQAFFGLMVFTHIGEGTKTDGLPSRQSSEIVPAPARKRPICSAIGENPCLIKKLYRFSVDGQLSFNRPSFPDNKFCLSAKLPEYCSDNHFQMCHYTFDFSVLVSQAATHYQHDRLSPVNPNSLVQRALTGVIKLCLTGLPLRTIFSAGNIVHIIIGNTNLPYFCRQQPVRHPA